jgi:predicted NAD/FAD-binding protein
MGFSLSLDQGRLEWSGQSYRSIFAQARNAFSPSFLRMLSEIMRFNRVCVADRDAGGWPAAPSAPICASADFQPPSATTT